MKVVIDPREARRFAAQLRDVAGELSRLNRTASIRLVEMQAGSWDDAKYLEFQKRFEEVSELLARFTERSVKYADYLDRKAAPIERYLGGR